MLFCGIQTSGLHGTGGVPSSGEGSIISDDDGGAPFHALCGHHGTDDNAACDGVCNDAHDDDAQLCDGHLSGSFSHVRSELLPDYRERHSMLSMLLLRIG